MAYTKKDMMNMAGKAFDACIERNETRALFESQYQKDAKELNEKYWDFIVSEGIKACENSKTGTLKGEELVRFCEMVDKKFAPLFEKLEHNWPVLIEANERFFASRIQEIFS